MESEVLPRVEHSGDVAVGLGANDVEGIVEGGDGEAALEQEAQAFDEVVGPFGEVGEAAFLDLAVVAIGLAQEDGRGRGAVEDALAVMATTFKRIVADQICDRQAKGAHISSTTYP